MSLIADAARGLLHAAPPDARANLRLADTLGAWIAGAGTEEGRALAAARAGALPLFDDGALDRIALAVATTRLTEIDDIHMRSCTTCGAVIAPVALTLAAGVNADGAALGRALDAGYEAMMRFGVAVDGPSVLYRGLWPTYLAAPLGAAAAAGVLLGLAEDRLAHALAIALAQTSGAPGGPAPGRAARWLLAGLAARGGVAAAIAAADGYCGDLSLLDGDWLRRTHGLDFSPDAFLQSASLTPETSYKPWCAAKQTTAAIDAFRLLLDDGVDPARITHVRVETPGAYRAMISHAPPGRLGRIVNVAWQLGLAAFRPDALLDVERADHADDARVRDFAARVEVAADPTLDAFYPARWPAKVIATLDDGSIAERLVTDALGDPDTAPAAHDVAEKFLRVAGATSEARAVLDLALRPVAEIDARALYAAVQMATAAARAEATAA